MRSLPSVLKEVKAGLRSSRCKREGYVALSQVPCDSIAVGLTLASSSRGGRLDLRSESFTRDELVIRCEHDIREI